ncbi:ABC transporter ATP-binding protein [Microvirga sp. TS319]|uniref:ABC transporter ATP-binding protein n=1 Tax=Microvirga sp. TS319 TaxID=3241165 RepID=UPI003519DB86
MIEFQGVTKAYRTPVGRKIVLSDLSVMLTAGVSYGILGPNGAGKSTLLRIIAGTERPDRGRVRRTVRVSWPLGFAGGFHGSLTGRENVAFVARIYGEDVQRVIRFVEDFAELDEYLDMPVGTYSSGMKARLAFGLSMAIEFECYLVDEITAVGDYRFQKRCAEAFRDRRKNSSIIMVSHSISTVQQYCDAGAILAGGKLHLYDSVQEASKIYHAALVE